MRLKWPKSKENHKARIPKLSVFTSQKSILRHYNIQNVKDRIQTRVYKINKQKVTHFSYLISVKVKKILRKSQAQFGKGYDNWGSGKLEVSYKKNIAYMLTTIPSSASREQQHLSNTQSLEWGSLSASQPCKNWLIHP